MAKPQNIDVDPAQLAEAKEGWGRFTKLLKWSVIASVAVLVFLGLVFIDW